MREQKRADERANERVDERADERVGAMADAQTDEQRDVSIDAPVESLNEEVIANTQRQVIAMEQRYNKANKVEVFEKGDYVRLKIPVEHRCSTDNKRIFCRVIKVKHGNRYTLQC
jgi:hypothetical protein